MKKKQTINIFNQKEIQIERYNLNNLLNDYFYREFSGGMQPHDFNFITDLKQINTNNKLRSISFDTPSGVKQINNNAEEYLLDKLKEIGIFKINGLFCHNLIVKRDIKSSYNSDIVENYLTIVFNLKESLTEAYLEDFINKIWNKFIFFESLILNKYKSKNPTHNFKIQKNWIL